MDYPLQKCNAVAFVERLEKGARTQPLILKVQVDKENTEIYVVKIFTTDEIQHQEAVAKEVLGSILATEFDLDTPKPILVKFTRQFMQTLPKALQNEIAFKDNRIKFGNLYLEGTIEPINPSKTIRKFFNRYDRIDTIYAFDNLIRNTDRNKNKPNMLLYTSHSEIALIDHEKSLNISIDILKELQNGQWTYSFKNHLFYPYLKKEKDKNSLFVHFEEMLKNLNINLLDNYVKQLEDAQHLYKNFEDLKLYLNFAKQNYTNFANILRKTLTI